MKLCGIYLITHIESGLKYVGQSVDIDKRRYQHALGLCKMRLGRAISKYGWAAFSHEILEICSADQLDEAERAWISKHNSLSPNGFNLTSGGGRAMQVSEETRAALSAASKGRKLAPSTKEKLRQAGLNRSEEYKAKISAANSARTYTPELIEKLSSGNKGREFSEQHRQNISKAGIGRPPTTLGMKHSAEARAKMSASRTGKKQTAEHKVNAVKNKAANRLLRDLSSRHDRVAVAHLSEH